MPIRAFVHPTTNEIVPLDQAVDVFEDSGIMPAGITQILVDDINDSRRQGAHLSPSMLIPETTCRREVVIKRLLEYDLDPLTLWDAIEGTLYHRMVASAKASQGRKREYEVPLPARASDREQVAEIEVFPGITLSGRTDVVEHTPTADCDDTAMLRAVEIQDIKTSRFPWKKGKDGKPISYDHFKIPEWTIQTNLYRYLYEAEHETVVRALWVWRAYRGSYDRTVTWRKIPIPLVPKAQLWEQIGEFTTTLKAFLEKGVEIWKGGDKAALEEFVRTVPMDGEINRMFHGQKCPSYCAVQKICFGLEGRTTF